jgi:CBS domain-containing protein
MKINAIMTTNVFSLSPDMPVSKAVDLLIERKISGLPVVDESRRLVGMFTEKDILRAILPSYVSQVGQFTYENSPHTIKNKVTRFSQFKVGEMMRREVVKIGSETPVSEAARVMLVQNVRRVPVVDANNHLVGIVARVDVLQALLKEQ